MKRALLVGFFGVLAGCAKTIPPDSYGVNHLEIQGMQQLDAAALRSCLATGQRERLGIDFGTSSELECNQPPFQGGRVRLTLWPWPWTAWPIFDASVFERDLERVERWFRARGFYEARIDRTVLTPPSAGVSDEIPATGEAPCRRNGPNEGCPVDIVVRVTEGQPTLVRSVAIEGTDAIEPAATRAVHRTSMLKPGDRWDETLYDQGKIAVLDALRGAGFACAIVEGHVELDPAAHTADIRYTVEPGPPSVFGNVTVEVENNDPLIPKRTVRAVAGIDRGQRYSPATLVSAQSAVYGWGSFGAVEVVASPRRHPETSVGSAAGTPASETTPGEVNATVAGTPGDDGSSPANAASAQERLACDGIVDVSIRVTPGRRFRWGIGGGLQSGTIRPGGLATSTTNTRIWDVHLISFVEHRNLFGGLRRLRIEERPKIVFRDLFPVARDPKPGNELRIDFRQPAFIERRTWLEISGRSDLGPDPWTYTWRHALDASIGLRRTFWKERILVGTSFHASGYLSLESSCPAWDMATSPINPPTCAHRTPDNKIFFLEQYIQFDRRNDARSPRKGVLASVDFHEGGFAGLSTWNYFRVVPEFRFYIPLPWRMVLAGRFGVGAAWVSNPKIPQTYPPRNPDGSIPNPPGYESQPFDAARELGPPQYRLRGGGPNDNRGFLAGQLGDVNCDGGEVYDSHGAHPSCGVYAMNHFLTPFSPVDGGLRKWVASLELRMHLTQSFGLVAFGDMGDVNRGTAFRFYRTNLTLGMGVRYDTVVGPLRLDIGWRVPAAAGPVTWSNRSVRCDPTQGFVDGCPPPNGRLPIVLSITIGEAF